MATELPTEKQLRQLPLRAIVAYAARCARRVQPLFDLPLDQPDRDHYLTAVQNAIVEAEACANRADASVTVTAAENAMTAADRAHIALGAATGASAVTAAATASAAATTAAAVLRASVISASHISAASAAAVSAASAANTSAASVAAVSARISRNAAVTATACDFKRLSTLFSESRSSLGGLGDPIDTREAGPLGSLWPDGPPDWYIAAKQRLDADLARIAGAKFIDVTAHKDFPSIAEFERDLLNAVSLCTRRPIESLNPSLSLQADLGVDSLMAMEIRNTLYERFPQLTEVSLGEFCTYTTLGELLHAYELRYKALISGVGVETTPPTALDSERLIIRLEVCEFAPLNEVADEVANLYRALNDAHVAGGGSGLVVDDWELFVEQGVPMMGGCR